MKKFLPVLALASVLGLSAALAIQARQISELKKELAASRTATEAQAVGEKEIVRLREQNEIFKAESQALRQQLGGAAAALASTSAGSVTSTGGPAAGASPAAAETSKSGEGAQEKGAAGFAKAMAKMFTDPEMKTVMRQQQAMGMRMMYGDLAKELGLAPDEVDKVMEILTDRQMEISAKSMEMMGDGDPAKMEAAGREANKAREVFDAKLKEALGADRFAQLQQYERTLGDRMMMQQYQNQFSASGAPLQDQQRETLLQIIYDERSKTPANAFDPTNKDVASQIKALQSDEAMHAFLASQEDFNHRVIERAREVLSPEQITAFEKIQKQMLEMQQNGIKMGRSMFQKK